MTLLSVYNTVVGKGYDLVPLGAREIIIVPSEFDYKEVSDAIFRIRNNTRGNWFQMQRLVANSGQTPFIKGIPGTPYPSEMKYITTKDSKDLVRIFIFSKSINHDCFFQVVNDFLGEDVGMDNYMRRRSAGFTDFKTCYGRSETLNLDHHSEDTNLLQHFLGN